VVSLAGTVTVEARLRGQYAFCFGRPVFWAFAHITGIDAVLDALKKLGDADLSDNNQTADVLDGKIWQDWIRGTFVAKSGCRVFNHRIGRLSYDPEPANVAAFTSFITSCVKNQPSVPIEEQKNV